MKKNHIGYVLIIVILGGGLLAWQSGWLNGSTGGVALPFTVTNFEECLTAGNAVMESYPRQCRHEGVTYAENIGNELEKADMIRLSNPRPGQTVASPVTITGEARGMWYWEATFPIAITDWDGRIIGEGYAEAVLDPNDPESTWMTENFVPFKAVLNFTILPESAHSDRGTLILQKANASDLPENDDALEIPVILK